MSEVPLKAIRRVVFGTNQAQFAALVETSQATVSRWENGELFPDLKQMATIRSAAIERGVNWRDEWFFDASDLDSEAAQ